MSNIEGLDNKLLANHIFLIAITFNFFNPLCERIDKLTNVRVAS